MHHLPPAPPRLRDYLLPGIILLSLLAIIVWLSDRFEYGSPMLDRPIIPFVIVMMLAALVYLYAARQFHRVPNSRQFLISILAVGLIARALFFFSKPILEDDYHRYLWEGSMVANGFSPYTHSPADAQFYDADINPPPELIALGQDSGTILNRVNHHSLTTVYPPVAQAFFVLAHKIKPWSLNAWRGVLLLIDIVIAGLLLLILRKLDRPDSQLILYWWNPILIKETFNSGHMDLILVLFILIALLCILHQRTYLAGASLTFAAATKLWPLYLVPLFLRASRALTPERRRGLIASAFLFVVLMLPVLLSNPLSDRSGFVAYGERWEMNDALFMVIHKATELGTTATNMGLDQIALLARIVTLLLLIIWMAILTTRPKSDTPTFLNHLVLAVGLFFMLSPTQFPWYYIWLIPFLTLSPRLSYLTLTLTLPIYYLRFYFAAHDQALFFHNVIVWIEYAPVIALLAYEHFRFKLRPAEYAGFINA